jgi:hypothetical protein
LMSWIFGCWTSDWHWSLGFFCRARLLQLPLRVSSLDRAR